MQKYIIIIILLSSCSVSKRAERKIEWLKSKNYFTTDTIIKRDTIHGFDTTVLRQFDTIGHTDTLIIEKQGVKTQTIIKWKERIVTQSITKADTVVITKIPPQVKCPEPSWWWKFSEHIFIGVLAVFAFQLLKRF